MTIADALRQGTKLLADASVDPPRLTAEVLLAHAVGCDRSWFYAHSDEELREVWWIHYGRYLHERMQGKPTQYITGKQEFYGREFRVTPDVLIPRPETEHVIEAALSLPATCILDLCTGSGAIAVTLSLELNRSVTASDVSFAALKVAKGNARQLGAAVDWVCADLGTAFAPSQFDLIVSNPPYIATTDQPGLQREVRDFEPELALYGGPDGLDVYRKLVPDVHRLLRSGGWLILEIGSTSAPGVCELLESWQDVEVRRDLAGLPRVVLARAR